MTSDGVDHHTFYQRGTHKWQLSRQRGTRSKEPFIGINVTSDTQGNYYLDQKDKIEGLVEAARVTRAKMQKLPNPLDNPLPLT